MAEIEQLSIGIEAEAKTANKVVENLSNKIGLLADALNGVDTGKLSGIATGIRKLSDAAVGFKGAKSTELSSLASALKKFDGIDTNSLYGISSSMKALSEGIKSAQRVDTSGFSNVISSISKLGGTKATSGTQNLIKIKDDLARFVDGMNRVESLTFDTTNLSKLLSGIRGLGSKASSDATKNLPTISAQFQNFVRQMNKIGSLTFDTSNLSSLISSISKMGGKGVSAAVGNIPKLAEAMKDLMTTLSRAPTVSQNVIDMANALAQLGKAGSGIGTATNSISKMSVTTIRASGKVKNALKGMQGGFRSLLRTLAPLIGAFQLFNFGKQAMEISSDLTEVQNVVDVTFGNFKNKIEDLAKVSITDFGMSELTAKQISSRFQAMGTAMGFAQGEMADMSVNLTKLAADMASFYNVEQEDAARSMQSIFTGETEPLRKYGLDLTQATLQEWAHKQGIDAKMQSMSQMEKTMLRYQYVLANTGAAQGDFLRTSESWANQVRILKQNFEQLASVIGGVLINAFKPVVKAVNAAMGAIIAFAKTISNALGQIFGWTYEESGGGFAQEFDNAAIGAGAIEDATGGAADNIKKMQAGLRAFDELKVINMPDNNQGGSGGGGGGTGGAGVGAEAAGGKWVQGESILEKYKSDIDTLYKLGEHIGKTLTDAMNNIDWDSVYQKAENFGKGLADFLNGLISPELFGATGRTIAGALNTAIHAALAFGETFDWEDFGLSIATGINEFFKTFKADKLAKTINTWIKGALKTATTMLKKTDFKMIGKKIGNFLAKIDWLGYIKEAGKMIWEALKSAFELYVGAFSAAPLETAVISLVAMPKLLKAITSSKFITGIGKLWDNFKIWGEKIQLATGALSGNEAASSGLAMLYPDLSRKVDGTKSAFSNFFSSVKNDGFWKTIDGGISNIRNNLGGLQKAAIVAVAGFAEFSVVSGSVEKITLGTENLLAEIGKIGGVVAVAAAAMYTALGPAGLAIAAITGVVGAVKGINDAINELQIETMFNALKENGGITVEELQNSFGTFVSNISGYSDTAREKLSSISESRKSIEETADSVGLIVDAVESGAYGLDDKIPLVIEKFNQLLNETKSIFEQEYDVIVGNIMGAYADILTAQGIAVPEVIQGLANLRDESLAAYAKLEEQAKSLEEQYESGAISADEFWKQYTPIIQQISNFNGNDEIDNATRALEDFYGTLDISKYVDGTKFDLETFISDIGQFAQIAENGKDSIEKFGTESSKSLDSFIKKVESVGLDAEKYSDDILSIYGANDEYVTKNTQAIDDSYQQYMGIIQDNLLNQIPVVVEQATKDYENLNWWQKLFTDKGEYVSGVLDEWKETILTPATEALGEIGVDGADKALEEGTEIINSLFDVKAFGRNEFTGTTNYKKVLKDNWEDILNGTSGAVSDLAKSTGIKIAGYAVDGYANKLNNSESKGAIENAAFSIVNVAMNAWAEAQDSHSPSRVTEGFGKDAVDGYNLGISNNASSSETAVSNWMSGLTSVFSEFTSLTKNAFSESWNAINANNTTTWDTMKNTITNAGNAIRSNVISVTSNLRTTITGAWNAIRSNTSSAWNNIRTLISTSWNNIRTNTSSATNNVRTLVSASWNNVRTLTSNTWNALKTATMTAWNSIKQSVSSATGNIQSTLQSAMGIAEQNWSGRWSSMASTVNNVLDSIRSAVSSAMSSISSMISSINGELDSLFAKAASASKVTVPSKGGSGGPGNKNKRDAAPKMVSPEINTAAFQNVNIPAFATGGITMKHTFAEIGEYNRPEAILPLTNGRAMGMIAESIYENYNGNADYPKDGYFDNGRMSELISETRRQNRLMEQQNQLLERILGKPTMEIGDVNNALVKYSMERGGNYRGGNMSRLAVAEEVYR